MDSAAKFPCAVSSDYEAWRGSLLAFDRVSLACGPAFVSWLECEEMIYYRVSMTNPYLAAVSSSEIEGVKLQPVIPYGTFNALLPPRNEAHWVG